MVSVAAVSFSPAPAHSLALADALPYSAAAGRSQVGFPASVSAAS